LVIAGEGTAGATPLLLVVLKAYRGDTLWEAPLEVRHREWGKIDTARRPAAAQQLHEFIQSVL
jgi:hypothetical protein